MNEETGKYMRRTIEVLKEIISQEPFLVRDKIKALIVKMEAALPKEEV